MDEKRTSRRAKDYVELRNHATPFGLLILEAIRPTGADKRLMSLRAVARFVHISPSTLERIITGEKENLETVFVARLCSVLHIPLDKALQALYPELQKTITTFFHMWDIYSTLSPEKQAFINDVIVSQVPLTHKSDEGESNDDTSGK